MGFMEMIERFVSAHERIAAANEKMVEISMGRAVCAPVREDAPIPSVDPAPAGEPEKKTRKPRAKKENPTPAAPEDAAPSNPETAPASGGSAPTEPKTPAPVTLDDVQKAVKAYAATRLGAYGGTSTEGASAKATEDARALMMAATEGTANATKNADPKYYKAIVDLCAAGWVPAAKEEDL